MAIVFGAPLLGIPLANSAKLFPAPEGRRKLAGGGAKRNHREWSKKIVRVPAGTPDQNSQQSQSRSGALSGRVVPSWRFRRLRFAPPPANVPRASGALGVCQQYHPSPHSIRRRAPGNLMRVNVSLQPITPPPARRCGGEPDNWRSRNPRTGNRRWTPVCA
jgi:hypothetical protein